MTGTVHSSAPDIFINSPKQSLGFGFIEFETMEVCPAWFSTPLRL
jgi:hypothetical protein